MSSADKVEKAIKVKGLSFRNVFRKARNSRSGTPSPLSTSQDGTLAVLSESDTQLALQQRLSPSPSPSNLSAVSADQPLHIQQAGQDASETSLQGAASPEPAEVVLEVETKPSLWDQAYNKLREDNVQLLDKYEVLLKRQLLSGVESAPQSLYSSGEVTSVLDPSLRRKQLNRIAEQGLRQQNTKGTICLAGRTISVRDVLTTLGKTIDIAKDWIDNAVQASPQASVAWSIICLALPLLTRPSNADKANHEGFTYVSSRMQYYIALEQLVLPEDGTAESKELQQCMESQLIDLYRHILEFQIKSILRFDQSTFKNIAGDIWGGTDWKDMHETILNQEKTIHQDLLNVSTSDSRNLLNHILQNAVEIGRQTQLLLEKNEQNSAGMLANLQQINQRELNRDERDCLQALYLDPPYSDFKDVIHERVEGTCMWFLSQQAYKDWIAEPEGCLLVSADPGCGKSVLAKFLVEHELVRSCPDIIICYFFFKDQIQNRLYMALCGLLHQLLSAEPRLIKHAQAKFHRYGSKLQGNAQALFDILADALADPISVPVIFVLDAMDECEEDDCAKLFRSLKTLQLRTKTGAGKLKMLLTSRPYHNVIFDFEPDNSAYDTLQVSSTMEPAALSPPVLHVSSFPKDWEVRMSKEGKPYYFDHNIKSTTWNDPRTEGLPKGWSVSFTKEGKALFLNSDTQTMTWIDPRPTHTQLVTPLVYDREARNIEETISIEALPLGWELAWTKGGRHYFIDHNTESTTWDDPRLPLSNLPIDTLQLGNSTTAATILQDVTQPSSSTKINSVNNRVGSKRIHIPGELESEAIGQEVNLVIKHRLQELYQRGTLKEEIRAKIEERLLSQSNRTYLWVYFLFDELQHTIKPTWKEIERKLATLPTSVNEAYEGILRRCATNEEIKQHAVRTLCVMLAAKRSLSLREIQIASRIEFDLPQSQHDDLDLEDDKDFANKLRNWCGLFVQVYRGRVTFIHQTGREFLLAKKISDRPQSLETWRWQGFAGLEYTNSIMAECCMVYLCLRHELIADLHESYKQSRAEATVKWPSRKQRVQLVSKFGFLEYAAQNWDWHFVEGRAAAIDPNSLLQLAWQICDSDSVACFVWNIIKSQQVPLHRFFHRLVIAASLEPRLFRALLENEDDTDQPDEDVYKQIFLEAARSDQTTIMKLILARGIDINDCIDHTGKTALHLTYSLSCTEFLLQQGAKIDLQDQYRYTPLHQAIITGNMEKVKLLVQHGASTTIPNDSGRDALLYAILYNRMAAVKIILDHNPDLTIHYNNGVDMMVEASRTNNEAIVRLLIEYGGQVNNQSHGKYTALHYAARGDNQRIVRLLLAHDADPSIQNVDGSTAQDLAAINGRISTTEILHQTQKPITRRSSLSDLWPLKPWWERALNDPRHSVYNKTGRISEQRQQDGTQRSSLAFLDLHLSRGTYRNSRSS